MITVKIHVPKSLTTEQRALYEKLAELETKIDPTMNATKQGSSTNSNQNQSN